VSRTAWLAAAALACATACSADRPSDDLRCTDPSECLDGRHCIDGYCVFDPSIEDAAVDADPRCPAVCTSCSGLFDDAGGYTTCNIDCSSTGACSQTVVCPPGMECNVTCNATNVCDNGVDCSAATACVISCNGTNACGDDVVCGTGPCTISCSGNNACHRDIDCSSSCSCDVSCAGGSCDNGPAMCPGTTCQDGNGCTSLNPGCSNCP
jgi:hypothetical protein